MHLVLGGNGAIGKAVIKELKNLNLPVTAVELTGKVDTVETINLNLLEHDKLEEILEGFTHVYLCVGLPYNSTVWLRDWPVIVTNVAEACKKTGCRLIYFDNTYMYGPPPLPVPFDENTQQNPITKKGLARKKATDVLLGYIERNEIQAVIGRSTDFYGPQAINSSLYISMLERTLEQKNPQSIYPKNIKHAYAYTLDNGRALVKLALDKSTYGEVWHLPVGEPKTIDEIQAIFNQYLDKNYEVSYIPNIVVNILSIFVPQIKEVKEMLYQFSDPHIMSDSKFKNKFTDFKVTPYEEGIEVMVNSFRKNN